LIATIEKVGGISMQKLLTWYPEYVE
jgi:hypothetical protein